MKSLNEDIKNHNFKPVYLLYGTEDYLKQQYKQKIKDALIPADDTMNYASFSGKKTNLEEVISLADTMPFFAEKRLIVVSDTGWFKGKQEKLAEFLKNLPDTVCLVFIEDAPDKRSRQYKAVTAAGSAVELGVQDERSLLLWIGSKVKKEGKQIRESAARHLIERAGTDMSRLDRELEKLFSYCMDKNEITREDIDEIVSPQLQNQIFAMTDAVAAKDQQKALSLYYDLLALKEPPMRIFYMLIRQFRLLYEVKGLMKKGYDKNRITKVTGLHPFVTGKYMQSQRSFTGSQLRTLLEDGADMEKAVKTGDLNDRSSVELFIVKYTLQ